MHDLFVEVWDKGSERIVIENKKVCKRECEEEKDVYEKKTVKWIEVKERVEENRGTST